MDNIAKCDQCEIQINTEDDLFYGSTRTGETYCVNCHEADLREGSVILLTGPDYPHDFDEPYSVVVGDAFTEDRWAEEWSDLDVQRVYVSTDGWHGYYQTTISGWSEVFGGWTTGGWDDGTARRKQPFNEWAEELFDGTITPPVNVALVRDPTSNVFSTAISVLVADGDVATFTEWLNGDLENLRYALT